MTLKEFIMLTLEKYNCNANLEFLAEYILGLRDSGIEEPQDYANNLQDFLQDSTDAFVADLIGYIETNIINGIDIKLVPKDDNCIANFDSEVEVDYEENSSNEAVNKVPLLTRQLREYSPERRRLEQQVSTNNNKKPCSNFSKKGFCKFGDDCKFSHIAPQPRRRNVSSRVKLLNLHNQDLLNPTVLNNIMSKYGSVINLTIFPEKSEAIVQFASGEEASRAVQEGIDDFDGDVSIELETIRQHSSVLHGFKSPINRTLKPQPQLIHNHHQQQSSPVSNENLQSLISIQKQQQSLLETNLSTQQTLLNHLQSPNISASERTELLASLSKIQEGVMGLQDMLKRTTDLVVEAASKSSSKSSTQNLTNNSSYHNRQHSTVRPFRPQNSYSARPFGNNTYIPGKSTNFSSYNNVYVARRPQTVIRPPGSNTLDLRPTTLKLSSLKSTSLASIHDLQGHFSPYGQLQSLIIVDNGESALIKYQKYGDAQRAMEKCSKEEGMDIEFVKK